MNEINIQVKGYKKWLEALKKNITQSSLQSALKVNSDMLILYWYIGKQLSNKIDVEGWFTKVIERLATALQKALPDVNGFSPRNLKYMRQFAVVYPQMLIGQQATAQLEQLKKTELKTKRIQIFNLGKHIYNTYKSIPYKNETF